MRVHKNLFWQPSRDGNCHGTGMSQATTASPKPSFKASSRVGYAVVGRGNAGWTSSKSGYPCPFQNCSQWPPAEKSGRGSLLNRPSRPPDDPIGRETELTSLFACLFLIPHFPLPTHPPPPEPKCRGSALFITNEICDQKFIIS